MNAEFFAAVADIEKEKGIPKEYMYEKITQALLAAFRKDHVEYEGDVRVLLDESAKKIQLVEYKVVVEYKIRLSACADDSRKGRHLI